MPLVVGEVERADLDAHRGRRAVDDRAHQLVPVARQRRELGDVVEERELVEPPTRVVSVARRRVARADRRPSSRVPAQRSYPSAQDRDLVAQSDQVVVLRRVFAELLLLGEGLAQERPRDVEVAAQRVEAGEVVAGVGGGAGRPTAAVDDRGDRRRRARASATRGRPRPRSVSGGSSVCSEPLPMIVPLIRGRASVSSGAASISATSSSVDASASAMTSGHDHADPLSVEYWRSPRRSRPRSARSRRSGAPAADRPSAPSTRSDAPGRPSATSRRRPPGRRARRVRARRRRRARPARAARMPAISPARRPEALVCVGLIHGRDGTRQRRAVTRGWRRSSGRRHPNRRRACRSA